jgi:pimeloyl-ACP methyl ester carboxylesterase
LVSIIAWVVAALLVGAILIVARLVLATRRLAVEAERKCPPTGRFVEVDGNKIRYVDQGEGRPIVFVHGLGAQLHHFTGPIFDRFGPGYRLIALDRPGSGYSTRARGATGALSEQAAVIRRFIEELGLEKPLIVGHSLGGAIALALAVEHPDAISGVALLSPLTHLETELRPEFRPLYIPSRLLRWAVANTIAVPRSYQYAEATLAYLFNPQKPPADYPTEGGGWLGLRPSHFYASATDFTAIPLDLGRIEARYGEIDMPVALMFGTADPIVAFAEHGAPMAGRVQNLDFEVVEGMGHMPQFVEPRRVVAFIRRIAKRAFDGEPVAQAAGGRPPHDVES